MKIIFLFFVLPVIVLVTAACEQLAPGETDAKKLYQHHCAGCHGSDGAGRFLRSVPANVETEKSFAEIVRQIKKGSSPQHKGHTMPDFSHLSDKQIKLIASYLLKLTRENKK